jgi:hypothetical protein
VSVLSVLQAETVVAEITSAASPRILAARGLLKRRSIKGMVYYGSPPTVGAGYDG